MSSIDLSAVFGLPPEDAIAFFRSKGYKVGWDWFETWREAHDRAFTVAKLARLDILQDIRAGLDQALAEGQSEHWFVKQLTPVLQQKGWWGKKIVVGKDGQAEVVQEGSPRRLKTIFRTNMQTAYAAAHWKAFQENAWDRPYLQYLAVMDGRTRRMHAMMHGKVFPIDSPAWDVIAPPNGHNCRCTMRALSENDISQRGLKVERDVRIITRELPAKRLANKRTGEVAPGKIIQRGVSIPDPAWPGKRIQFFPDPGWDYSPGKSVTEGMARLVDQKLLKTDAFLGAQLVADTREIVVHEWADNYRAWLARLASDNRAKSETPTVGAIELVDLLWLRDNGKALPNTAEIGISNSVIDGPKAIRHELAGDAISAAVWEALPEMIREPLAVAYDNLRGTLLYILPDIHARRPMLVVEFDYRRKNRGKNMIVSGYKPLLDDLDNRINNGSVTVMRGGIS